MTKPLMPGANQVAMQSSEGKGSYIAIFALISVLAFIVAKDIALPRVLTMSVAAAGLFAFVYFSFSKPIISLLILIAYAPFTKVVTGQFGGQIVGLNLTNVMIFIIFAGLIFHATSQGQRAFTKASLTSLILLFCFWGFLSLLRAKLMYGEQYNMDSFFVLFKRWITPVALYFIGLNIVRDKESFKKAMFAVMLVTFMIGLMAIRDYMNAGSGSLESTRVGGVFDQPNMLGAFFVYNMFFFLGFFLAYWRSFKYWLLLIPFVVCFRGVMVTFSRGAYIAFGFGGAMIMFFRSKVLFVLSSILLILMLLNPVFLPEGIQYRLAQTFSGGQVISTYFNNISDSSVGKRMLIWQGAAQMIKDEPLFGFGYGTFPTMIGSYVPHLKEMDAHNTYLILAAEMGIPSLVIFLSILFVIINKSRWLLRYSEDRYFKAFALGMLGGMFGLIVANMFGSRLNTEEVSAYFWLLSGLLMRAVIMRKNNEIA